MPQSVPNLATINGGQVITIANCYIIVPTPNQGQHKILIKALPDISDSKSAKYNDEGIIGRGSPLKTYAYSENRTISMGIHFYVLNEADRITNIRDLRIIQSALYPRQNSGNEPYRPPVICRLKCGILLSGDTTNLSSTNASSSVEQSPDLCCVLKSYSVKFPTDVAWDTSFYTPYKFDVETSWDVVYKSDNSDGNGLPGQERIIKFGV